MILIDKAEAIAVLRKAQTASCTCQIKTPDPEWHSHNCRYRILREAEAMIDHVPDAEAAMPPSAALSVPEAEQRVARIAASLFPGGYDENLKRILAARAEVQE